MKIFNMEPVRGGVRLQLSERTRRLLGQRDTLLQVKDWASSGDPDLLRGLSALSETLQGLDDLSQDWVEIAHQQVAALSDLQASALNLPASVPYQLRVWSTGNWNDDTYILNTEFMEKGQPVFVDARDGAIIKVGHISYRLPDPIYDIIELVANFPSDRDGKIEAHARLAQLLGDSTTSDLKVLPDDHVANIRIRHVAAFSASVGGSLEDPELSATLFGRHSVEDASEKGDSLDEAQQILDSGQTVSFNKQFFESATAKPTYVLKSGEYLFIDKSVRPAFQAFRKVCGGSAETRKAFLAAPQAVLAAQLSSEIAEPDNLIELAFVETSQFSERVLGINKWQAPNMPWLATVTNDWGTDMLVFEQPGLSAPVVVAKENLQQAIDAVKVALQEGATTASLNGASIPVSLSLLEKMKEFQPESPDPDPAPAPDPEPDPDPEPQADGPYVVETIDNFESINFVRSAEQREPQLGFVQPRTLVPATTLMEHQTQGLHWLIESYNQGAPGVLIADDMGLGKTLQALVFLAMYQEQTPERLRKPCLIVAPTGLLSNWLEEVETHLGQGGLGHIECAYDKGLRDLRDGHTGQDIDFGIPMLNTARLESAGVVLTTYESLRNYNISFASVSFGVAVFDEVQKVKNPKIPLSRAAAAMNAAFQVGLSGTPVENSLSDLWSIMDVIAPRRIRQPLLEFMKEYAGDIDNPETHSKLTALHRELTEPADGFPAPILRRMKSEVFRDGGLPKKIIHSAESTCGLMSEDQAAAYTDQLHSVQRGQIKMIQALQAFKRISLSHRPYEIWLEDPGTFAASSGRLAEFFKILDDIAAKQEKVLIFVESREVQPILAQVLKEEYRLPKLPLIINGEVNGAARQGFVTEFQTGPAGFNAIIISPKAGGVGLNLVAANHVVHLQRWWNPAVEDQCNDRAYRIRQERDVHIYTPVSRHPVDAIPSYDLVLDGILTQKRTLANSLFVPSELGAKDFTNTFMGGEAEPSSSYREMSLAETYALETGEAFEDYVRSALMDAGFKVSLTPKSHDGKCDLVAKKGQSVVLCQVKQVRSDKTLQQGVDEIIDSRARYESHNPTHLALITNAKAISGTQHTLARQHSVIVLGAQALTHYGHSLAGQLT